MYLVAILFPPVAVIMCNKPIQAILCVILCFFFWFPGVIHAIMVVAEFKANERNNHLINALGPHYMPRFPAKTKPRRTYRQPQNPDDYNPFDHIH
jgi:uncharacterized membrane protein YqaE (UPF0057 family)